MFNVELTRKCEKEFSRLVKSGVISKEELLVIRTWVTEMRNFGPEYIASCGYWDDHPLDKDRKGERASSFSASGRIIYKVFKGHIDIKIIKISPDHNYNL